MSRAARPDWRLGRIRRRRRERARLRRRERFLADAMHQLRNAVGTLATQAAMIGRAQSLDEQRDTAQALEHRLLQLGRFLHQLEKLDRRQPTADLPVFDAVECARSLVYEFAGQARARGVDLGWVGEAFMAAMPVYGQVDEIHEALVNLLDNAIRHTPSGGRVDVSVESSTSQECRFRVADQGPGLPPAERRRVFARFAQERSGTPAGQGRSGLGLDIARRLVHANRGRIEAGDGLPHGNGKSGLLITITLQRAAPARQTR